MDEEQTEKRGRGRPRKTIESPTKRDASDEPKAKQGRGRPKGNTNSSVDHDSSDEPKAKRGRGRPKGSTKRNKKAVAKNPSAAGKKGRGRPPRKAVSGDKEADAGSDSSQGGASSASEGKNE